MPPVPPIAPVNSNVVPAVVPLVVTKNVAMPATSIGKASVTVIGALAAEMTPSAARSILLPESVMAFDPENAMPAT